MSDISLRSRSSTEIVDAAFQLYRREPVPFITAVALIYVPWLIIAAVGSSFYGAIGADPNAGANLDVMAVLGSSLWTMAISIGGLLANAVAAGVVSVMGRDLYLGRAVDLGAAFKTVARRLGTLLAALIAFGMLFVLALLALIFPGLYVYARFFAIKQTVLLEDRGFSQAFSRSSELTDGLKRHVLNTIGLIFILGLAISLGAAFLTELLPGTVLPLVVRTAASVIVYPLVGITETLLYYDLRIRREGFDIEYLASLAPLSQPEQPTPT
jgi:hypothetical protein